MERRLVEAVFIFTLFCLTGCSNPEVTTAYEVECTDQANGKCSRYTTWIVTVNTNKNAGTCAILYKDVKTGFSNMVGDFKLTYIDENNWNCEQPVVNGGVSWSASKSNGVLSIESTWNDGSNFVTKQNIKSRNVFEASVDYLRDIKKNLVEFFK